MNSDEARQRQLEEYARQYYTYTQLCSDTMTGAQGVPDSELEAAHARASSAFCEEQRVRTASGPQTPEQTQLYLKELAATCEKTPTSLDERFRIINAASAYAQTVMALVSMPPWTVADSLAVLRMATQMLQAHNGQPPLPDLPQQSKLVPNNSTTRRVTPEDIAHWRLHPEKLVRKTFLKPDTREDMGGAFLVVDYVVKLSTGRCYEIQWEETGEEVFTEGVEYVLEMVAISELVTMGE
ncbi:hypothetical protein Hypma_005563 [Hypsizygus marmoreus]|uniref:Uncharacterized protein n=1 Tax=Hypsizygus marmoreus TaxID=39966 RepID=A0A369K6U1_HYPMA|nr:hypothetical protein Hypma_005563 [Hypsizygus marmoreus]